VPAKPRRAAASDDGFVINANRSVCPMIFTTASILDRMFSAANRYSTNYLKSRVPNHHFAYDGYVETAVNDAAS
jgi:hypothetical protein